MNIYFENQTEQSITPQLYTRCHFSLGHACQFLHIHLGMTEILYVLFAINCS